MKNRVWRLGMYMFECFSFMCTERLNGGGQKGDLFLYIFFTKLLLITKWD